jgi:hypothetical protein
VIVTLPGRNRNRAADFRRITLLRPPKRDAALVHPKGGQEVFVAESRFRTAAPAFGGTQSLRSRKNLGRRSAFHATRRFTLASVSGRFGTTFRVHRSWD